MAAMNASLNVGTAMSSQTRNVMMKIVETGMDVIQTALKRNAETTKFNLEKNVIVLLPEQLVPQTVRSLYVATE